MPRAVNPGAMPPAPPPALTNKDVINLLAGLGLLDSNGRPIGGPVPVGAMLAFAVNSAPAGWLLCNGGTFSVAAYPMLNTYLGGNTLPNMQGVAPMGAGGNGVVLGTRDATGSVVSHTHVLRQMDFSGGNVGVNNSPITYTGNNATTTGSTGGGANVPPNYGVAWFIKAS